VFGFGWFSEISLHHQISFFPENNLPTMMNWLLVFHRCFFPLTLFLSPFDLLSIVNHISSASLLFTLPLH
jgi:hypothetical protein